MRATSVVKYSRTIGGFPSDQDFVPAMNGDGENGCILTTHTLIVNPVSDTDRTPYRGKGSSLNLFIRIPAVLSRCNRAERGDALRTNDFETRTPCQNSPTCCPHLVPSSSSASPSSLPSVSPAYALSPAFLRFQSPYHPPSILLYFRTT